MLCMVYAYITVDISHAVVAVLKKYIDWGIVIGIVVCRTVYMYIWNRCTCYMTFHLFRSHLAPNEKNKILINLNCEKVNECG